MSPRLSNSHEQRPWGQRPRSLQGAGHCGIRPGHGLCSPNEILPLLAALPPERLPPPCSRLALRALTGASLAQCCWVRTQQRSGDSAGQGVALTPQCGCVPGILYGTMTMELGGRVTVECEKNNFQAELEFKLKVALAAAPRPPRGLGGRGAWAGERRGLGWPPLALSVPQGWFPDRCTWTSSSWLPCSTAGLGEGKGLPTGHTAELGQAQAPSPPRGTKPWQGPSTLELRLDRGRAWPPPASVPSQPAPHALGLGAHLPPTHEEGAPPPQLHDGAVAAALTSVVRASSRVCPHSPSSGAARASTRSPERSHRARRSWRGSRDTG